MNILISTYQNPQLNCSLEEYYLKNKDSDLLILYQNLPSVVLGKHQNALSEVNYQFCIENKIPIVRRMSGGGTVFHDLGNINFSFIQSYMNIPESKANFSFFLKPVIEFLKSKGLNAYQSGRNDIFIDEFKVSGNAQHLHIQNQKTLHHGTLLFSSNLHNLSQGLKLSQSSYIDKSVNSVRSKVKNISDFLNPKINIEEFKNELILYLSYFFNINKNEEFSINDHQKIENLAHEKYTTFDWNLCYSPSYQMISNVLELKVNKGLIIEFKSKIELYHSLNFIGIPHRLDTVKEALESQNIKIENSQIFNDFF